MAFKNSIGLFNMTKERLTAFSDGVIAILITIMVLEFKAPHGDSLESLRPIIPAFLSYVMSYIYLGIYWNNHHHLFQATEHVNGAVLWANLHLLFWLSLVPFITAWMGENHFASLPVAIYGVILLCAAIAYFIMVQALLRHHGRQSIMAKAIGNDFKGKISIVFYATAIAISFINPLTSCGIYALVALIWLVPDRRIENILK